MKQQMMRWQCHLLNRMQIIPQTDNHASRSSLIFYRPDALPHTQPAASKHSYHIHNVIIIYTIIKTTNLSVTEVGVAGWARSTHAMVSASKEQTLSGRGARVYTCTYVHDNTLCKRLPK